MDPSPPPQHAAAAARLAAIEERYATVRDRIAHLEAETLVLRHEALVLWESLSAYRRLVAEHRAGSPRRRRTDPPAPAAPTT